MDRIKEATDHNILMKIPNINPGDNSQSKVIERLRAITDDIHETESLAEHIKCFKDLVEVYTYGAKILFGKYKCHIWDVNDDCCYEIMQKIEDNIDLTMSLV